MRRASSLVSLEQNIFFRVSNCAQKSSHLRFSFFDGVLRPSQPPSQKCPSIVGVCAREPRISVLWPLNLLKPHAASRLDCPKEEYQWVRRQITGRANCHAGSQLVPPMWSKELAARKGICALSPATWFCLADGASIFPLRLVGPVPPRNRLTRAPARWCP